MLGLSNSLYLDKLTMKARSFLAAAVGRGDRNQALTYNVTTNILISSICHLSSSDTLNELRSNFIFKKYRALDIQRAWWSGPGCKNWNP